MEFSHFRSVDRVLCEPRKPYLRLGGNVWPSEASAVALPVLNEEVYPAKHYGKCHRAAFLSMVGMPQTNPAGPRSTRRMRLGTAIELDNVALSMEAGTFAAAQVKHKSLLANGVSLPIVLDIVLVDPVTHKGHIVEMKSIYGYHANAKVLKKRRPKPENLMQLAIYLDQVRDGKTLKEYIRLNLVDLLLGLRTALDPSQKDAHWEKFQQEQTLGLTELVEAWRPLRARHAAEQPPGRIPELRFDPDKVLSIDDGPVGGKLAYESRDDANTGEFDVTLITDPDGTVYPAIDGYPYRIFSLQSVYQRFAELTKFWNRHWAVVLSQAAERGISTASQSPELLELSQQLALGHLPPADFEYRYPTDKVEFLFEAGAVGKAKYAKWKKGNGTIGDWNCSWCPYMKLCVPMNYPDMRMKVEAMTNDEDLEEVAA